MVKFEVRPATEDDAKAIEDLIFEWLCEMGWTGWRCERAGAVRQALLDKNYLLLVAEADRRIVGLLHLIFYLDILHGGLNGHVNLLLVKKEYRRMKIGSKLLDEAVKKAKERDVIEVHVDTMFEEAAKFYRRYGFKDEGVWLELSLQELPTHEY